MRQVRSNRVIPIHSHQAQGWAGNETSTDPKEPAQNSNDKADNDQINRVDVRVGDWKKHGLFPAAPQDAKQKRCHRVQNDGLAGDKQKCDAGVSVSMVRFEMVQPITKKVKNQEEVDDDKNRIGRQLNGKGSETLGSLLFHSG